MPAGERKGEWECGRCEAASRIGSPGLRQASIKEEEQMKNQTMRGLRRAGIFAATAVIVLLAGILAVLLFGIQSVIGLLGKLMP